MKNIIRQNKKDALLQFLFGSQDSMGEPETQNHLNQKIERLQNQINLLQQKVIQLEAKFMTVEQDSKYALSEPSRPLESSKTSQQGDSEE